MGYAWNSSGFRRPTREIRWLGMITCVSVTFSGRMMSAFPPVASAAVNLTIGPVTYKQPEQGIQNNANKQEKYMHKNLCPHKRKIRGLLTMSMPSVSDFKWLVTGTVSFHELVPNQNIITLDLMSAYPNGSHSVEGAGDGLNLQGSECCTAVLQAPFRLFHPRHGCPRTLSCTAPHLSLPSRTQGRSICT